MVSGTLYTYPENFRAYKVLVAAQYAGAAVKESPGFVFGETNRTKEFLAKFPMGKVPAFESDDKKVLLTESNAIAYYVSNNQLRGADDLSKAQIMQWMHWADSEILPSSCAWVFPLLNIMPYQKDTVERAKKDIEATLAYLNQHLLTRTFLVGERITLADISVFCTLLNVYQYVLDADVRKPYANVNRWFVTLMNQPQFRTVIGADLQLCTEALVFDPKKAKKPGKKPPQPQQPKKEQAKPQKEEPAKEEEEDAPVDDGKFDMDAFKRVYSNEDESKSIPYFFEKFDPEEYSVWYGEYKFRDELTKVFMSCNLISGMYQRLDKLRKIGFASVCLFGEDNNSTISGVWAWKGQDLIFPTSPDLTIDYESYEWRKLQWGSDECKKLVQQYFSWTGTDKEGRKFNQGKIFK